MSKLTTNITKNKNGTRTVVIRKDGEVIYKQAGFKTLAEAQIAASINTPVSSIFEGL